MATKRQKTNHESTKQKRKHEREIKLQRAALQRSLLSDKSAGGRVGRNSPKGCHSVFVFSSSFRAFVIIFFFSSSILRIRW